jgi:protein phosphatase
MTVLKIPEFALVVLIGASGSGKSTFAKNHFKSTEIISSDYCRGLVSDDENDQNSTADAFAVLHFIADRRLAGRKLTVIDATNVRPEDRKPIVALARKHHALPVAIVVNPGEGVCQDRNKSRPDRQFGPHVVRNQTRTMKRGLRGLRREGFRSIYELRSVEEVETATIERQRLWTDKRDETGPFDIIGDVHGCFEELACLLERLGYDVQETGVDGNFTIASPENRKVLFVGDLVDRGPRSPDVLRLVMSMVKSDQALCVLGNHDAKFLKWIDGRKVQLTHGLADTVEQMEHESDDFKAEARTFIDGLVSHYILDHGNLAVAHAGIREDMQGRASGAIRQFCLYGETTGEIDEFGLPVRHNWAAEYRGDAKVVYGHTPAPNAEWLNNTICLDTGCVFGGELTALRYPELELVSVPANKVYAEPIRPLMPEAPNEADGTAQQLNDDVLDFEDVSGKRILTTRLAPSITIYEENAAAAIEVMSRFTINPKWLIYLPPTMSPSETSSEAGMLEHPAEAFSYFKRQRVEHVICQEKHMGSRAIIVVCRDDDTAERRFGVTTGETGVIYSRTGRAFFRDRDTTENLLSRCRISMNKAGIWEALETDWACIDAEIMPWSVKAQSLIVEQYAPVGAAARAGLTAVIRALSMAKKRGLDLDELQDHFATRLKQAENYALAYQGYCWPTESVDDLKIAPFHLLATEGAVHMERDHDWHMSTLAKLSATDDPIFVATPYVNVDLSNEDQIAEASSWWNNLTANGGEGMVIKPQTFIARGGRGVVQPGIKCRGKEYLRIIYGPEYDSPENLVRLRKRGLGKKRSLASREFALGHEALSRFVAREPLRRIHECVFAILAMESEPVDPRL